MDYHKIYPLIGITARGSFSSLFIFTQYGKKRIVKKYYYPYNPKSAEQQAWREIFSDAVENWQGFDNSVKNFYNTKYKNDHMSGYNRYIGLYLGANFPPVTDDYLLLDTVVDVLLLMEDGDYLLLETGDKIVALQEPTESAFGEKALLETGDGILLEYYLLLMEDGDFLLLETGDKIVGE